MTVAYPMTSIEPYYVASAPSLVVADSHAALHRALGTLEDAGVRPAGHVMVAEGGQRLDQHARLGLLWVEVDEADALALSLLARVNGDVLAERYSAVVAAPAHLIDPLSAVLTAPRVELVIGGSALERATALALARASFEDAGVRDSAADESASRLRQLSEEVSRIAATLARLSGDGSGASPRPGGTEAPPTGDLPQVPAETVRAVIRARRQRADYLPSDLFADPAWDMLLDLLQAELVQHRVPVSSLCLAAAVPATTALRWIKTMTDRGLLTRRADPHDGRRVFIEMARPTSLSIRRFFAEVKLALV